MNDGDDANGASTGFTPVLSKSQKKKLKKSRKNNLKDRQEVNAHARADPKNFA